jgi:serine/threonine-protein kinase
LAGATGSPPAPLVGIDGDTIAASLVDQGLLTPYQADQITAGRTKFNLGPYTVTDFIGQGGMGQVYKGVQQVMGRECAIKVLPMSKATPDAIANFSREIRTQAQLDHANLVRAYDAGRDGSVHYLVVEYVPGVDLRKLIRGQGHPLTQQQAASVVLQAARGLEHAHKRGLIHRDIKPGNILVTSEGIAKVSDLGLAGFMQDAANDPRAGKVVGTADYLAPEQIRTPGEVTFLADIYSLGCTLYYAICGKVPFPGGTAREKARRHCEETPWHPRRFNPDLNEEFIDVIADMMEKDPKSRIQSAAEVVARLEQWAGDAAPIASRTSIRSPWSAPPLPAEEEKAEIPDTDGGEFSASAEASHSQTSQVTGPSAAAGSDTTPLKPGKSKSLPIALPLPDSLSPTAIVAITLMVAVPLSMFAGALVAAIAFWLVSP